MAQMVRKQIYLEKGLDRELKERAKRSGQSEAEIVRGALKMAFHPKDARPELEAWREFRRFCEERSELKPEKLGRQWKRDDLYEERLMRKRNA